MAKQTPLPDGPVVKGYWGVLLNVHRGYSYWNYHFTEILSRMSHSFRSRRPYHIIIGTVLLDILIDAVAVAVSHSNNR